jgi:large subunit ribosomal protein L23
MPDLYRAVIEPVMTEKSNAAYADRKEYTFRVHLDANKHQIRAAVESLFGVHVVHIRTLVQRSRRKTRGRTAGTRPMWKKAYVRLKEGETIEGFEG